MKKGFTLVELIAVLVILGLISLITIQTVYFALLYKANTATGAFLICFGITLFVACDGGLEKKKN